MCAVCWGRGFEARRGVNLESRVLIHVRDGRIGGMRQRSASSPVGLSRSDAWSSQRFGAQCDRSRLNPSVQKETQS